MGAKESFKVIIGGGSISGLTMANMLQLYGIDFVVLEAWHDITPQVGASIGMLPHGNRILDQLGLYEKILELCPPLDSFHFRDETGKVISEFRGMNQSMHERHGYPITFLDRQMVLQVLYNNIKDKTKILTKKRVEHVNMTDDGVTVRTADGSTYTGDILIGADGIHSTVRSEMWRIAGKEAPGWIPADEKDCVPCDFGCIFGISRPCDGIEPGASNSVFRKHQSYIINGGPEGRVYWFYFFKLPQRAYGDDIPKYTQEDHDRILKERENDNITPTLKFKEMLEKKITSVLVPLQEYVFRQWHYKRIITIGDSAHKFHPIAGHGGNACVESSAALVNGLVELLDSTKSGPKPSLMEINKLFAQTQEIRQARTTKLKCHSHDQQRTELLDTPLHEFVAFNILPRTDVEDVTFNFSRNMPLAEKLNSHKIAPKHRLVPYKDELLSVPKPRGAVKWYFIAFYLTIAALVHYGMWVYSSHYELGSQLGSILETGEFADDPSFRLKRKYIGIKFIDDYLVFLAAAYMPGVNEWAVNFGTLQRYFLGGLIQPITVWAVEAYRKRNKLTPVSLFTLFLTLVQWAGVGIYMPIYYALYTFISEPETYWWPLNREVPIEYAASLKWAVLGYIIPTILMFIPWGSPSLIQNFESLWQPSPMFIPPICGVLGYLYAKRHNTKPTQRKARVPFPDLPHVKTLYLATAALGLLLHVWILVKIWSSSEMTMSSVFWPDFSPTPKELGEGLRQLFMADFWGFHAATYGWLCMAVWDIKRVGRSDVDVAQACALIALGSFVIGPGTVTSLVWYWRECALAKTTFATDVKA